MKNLNKQIALTNYLKSQLIKQQFKHIRLQVNNRIIDIFIDRTTCI
jgi:hypothetical protein